MRNLKTLSSTLSSQAAIQYGTRALERISRASRTFLASSLSDSLVVLNYHRVESPTSAANNLIVSRENFKSHMATLSEDYRPTAIKNWSFEKRGPSVPLSARKVAVTFDDGYLDTFEKALPILEEYQVPATVFVTTGMIGKNAEFWWDELEELVLRKLTRRKLGPLESLEGCAWPMDFAEQSRDEIFLFLAGELKKRSQTQIRAAIRELRKRAGLRPLRRAQNRAMTLSELKEMAKHPLIDIGAHTVSHASLGYLDADTQFEEISSSKKFLERELGKKIETIAYPFGGTFDFNEETKIISQKLGFKMGFSTLSGIVDPYCDRFALPRMFIKNWKGATFARKLRRYQWVS